MVNSKKEECVTMLCLLIVAAMSDRVNDSYRKAREILKNIGCLSLKHELPIEPLHLLFCIISSETIIDRVVDVADIVNSIMQIYILSNGTQKLNEADYSYLLFPVRWRMSLKCFDEYAREHVAYLSMLEALVKKIYSPRCLAYDANASYTWKHPASYLKVGKVGQCLLHMLTASYMFICPHLQSLESGTLERMRYQASTHIRSDFFSARRNGHVLMLNGLIDLAFLESKSQEIIENHSPNNLHFGAATFFLGDALVDLVQHHVKSYREGNNRRDTIPPLHIFRIVTSSICNGIAKYGGKTIVSSVIKAFSFASQSQFVMEQEFGSLRMIFSGSDLKSIVSSQYFPWFIHILDRGNLQLLNIFHGNQSSASHEQLLIWSAALRAGARFLNQWPKRGDHNLSFWAAEIASTSDKTFELMFPITGNKTMILNNQRLFLWLCHCLKNAILWKDDVAFQLIEKFTMRATKVLQNRLSPVSSDYSGNLSSIPDGEQLKALRGLIIDLHEIRSYKLWDESCHIEQYIHFNIGDIDIAINKIETFLSSPRKRKRGHHCTDNESHQVAISRIYDCAATAFMQTSFHEIPCETLWTDCNKLRQAENLPLEGNREMHPSHQSDKIHCKSSYINTILSIQTLVRDTNFTAENSMMALKKTIEEFPKVCGAALAATTFSNGDDTLRLREILNMIAALSQIESAETQAIIMRTYTMIVNRRTDRYFHKFDLVYLTVAVLILEQHQLCEHNNNKVCSLLSFKSRTSVLALMLLSPVLKTDPCLQKLRIAIIWMQTNCFKNNINKVDMKEAISLCRLIGGRLRNNIVLFVCAIFGIYDIDSSSLDSSFPNVLDPSCHAIIRNSNASYWQSQPQIFQIVRKLVEIISWNDGTYSIEATDTLLWIIRNVDSARRAVVSAILEIPDFIFRVEESNQLLIECATHSSTESNELAITSDEIVEALCEITMKTLHKEPKLNDVMVTLKLLDQITSAGHVCCDKTLKRIFDIAVTAVRHLCFERSVVAKGCHILETLLYKCEAVARNNFVMALVRNLMPFFLKVESSRSNEDEDNLFCLNLVSEILSKSLSVREELSDSICEVVEDLISRFQTNSSEGCHLSVISKLHWALQQQIDHNSPFIVNSGSIP